MNRLPRAPHSCPRSLFRGMFDFKRFLMKEAELEPLNGEIGQFKIVPAHHLHPVFVDVKELEKMRLKDKAPEAVDVIACHVKHFDLLGREKLITIPKRM
jgi:hypothetical protein